MIVILTQTYPRCENSARLASTQECVTELYDCGQECQNLGGTGTLNTQLGLCDCQIITDPRSECTDSCLSCRPTGYLETIDGVFHVTVNNCEGVEIYHEQLLDVYSFSPDLSDPHNFQLVNFPSDGSVSGSLFFDNQETINILDGLVNIDTNGRKKRDLEYVDYRNDRYRRQSGAESTNLVPPTIPNPLFCLEVGEAIIFQINQAINSSLFHYPIYNKEHLLNSNPRFDYGAFRQLTNLIQSGVNISLFVHTFSEPGTFYFSDSIVSSNEMVVVVMQDGTTCERGGDEFRVLPSSSSYLIQYGIVSQPILNQEPNFTAVFSIILIGFLILCIVVLGILIWSPGSVGVKIPNTLKRTYRKLNEPQIIYIKETSQNCDSFENSGVELAKPVYPQSTAYSLENFNVKTFYDKLEDQNLHVSTQLTRQQADLVRFYDQILQQTESLKSLISESCVIESVKKNRFFQANLEQSSESSMCHQKEVCQEAQLVAILKEILTRVKKILPHKDKPAVQKWMLPQDIEDKALVKEDIQKFTVEMETLVSMCMKKRYMVLIFDTF